MRAPTWFGVLILVILVAGCGGTGSVSPVEPDASGGASISPEAQYPLAEENRHLWGVWEVMVTADHREVEVVPLRAAGMHLNLLAVLETAGCVNCLTIDNLTLFPPDELSVDVTLRHPFSDDEKTTVFDVRGIFITGGDYTFPASGRSIAWRAGTPRLVYPDGYTSLHNPTEFPASGPGLPLWKYFPGEMARGGDLTATLNPFVAYGSGEERRAFLPRDSERKTLRIRPPDGAFAFGYAVDACWVPPGGPVIDPLVDFPPEANCLEPYEMAVTIEPGLGSEVGSRAPILVEVYDHHGLDTFYFVSVEAPDLLSGARLLSFAGVGEAGSYLFTGTVTNELGAGYGDHPVLVRAASVEADPNLGFVDAWNVDTVRIKRGWARTWGGQASMKGQAVAVDDSGDAYVAGFYAGIADFDPGFGTEERTAVTWDAFLSKFDSDGAFQRVTTLGEEGLDEYPYGLALDGSGNLYVAGSGDNAPFLVKVGPDGAVQWVLRWEDHEYDDVAGAVAVDGMGNVYLTSRFTDTVDLDPGPGEDIHTSHVDESGDPTWDVYLSKFNSSGDFQWALTWGGPWHDVGEGVALDAGGNVYVTGSFWYTVDFDPGAGIEERMSNGRSDVFLTKLDSDGEFQWVQTWGGPGQSDQLDAGNEVAVDDSGNVYVTGAFEGLVDFDPGPATDERYYSGCTDVFLSKFSPDGGFQWVLTWGGVGYDEGESIALDGSSGVCVTGSFSFLVDFDPGPDTDRRSSHGYEDVFLVKVTSGGEYIWTRTWGGEGTSYYQNDTGMGASVDGSGNIYVTGFFAGIVDFDPGEGIDIHEVERYTDVFLSKFPPDGNW